MIDANFSVLFRSINPSVELLGELGSVDVIEKHLPTIKRQQTLNEKNEVLLDALKEVPKRRQKTVMTAVTAALRSTGQEHVANIFSRESDKVVMSDEHYRLLNVKQYLVCQFLEPRDGLVHHLVSVDVFTISDKKSILYSKLPVNEMACQTMEILERKSDDSFEKFISALNAANQDHVVCVLTGVGRKPMSEEHRELLQRKIVQLVTYLDPLNGVLLELVAANAISNHDKERIRSLNVGDEMVMGLVETLVRKPDDAFGALIKALYETGQSHVTYILTGESDSRPLSEECRAKLMEKRATLVESITTLCLVSTLISKGVFSPHDQRRVESRATNNQKAEMMLDLIARKSQAAFNGFIDTLQECHHEWIAKELMGFEVSARAETRVKEGAEVVNMESTESELCEDMQHAVENNNIRQLGENLSSDGISVSRIDHGSIIVKFRCRDHAALASLQELYLSRQLDQLFNEAFRPQFAAKGLEPLRLRIQDEEFQRSIHMKLMTPEHRQALLSSAERLLAKVTVSNELLDKLCLCKCRRQAIEQAATREQQVKTLVDIVSRQPDCTFAQFLNALTDCNQHEAVAIISDFRRSAVANKDREFHKTRAEKVELQLEAKPQAMTKKALMLKAPEERLRKIVENETERQERLQKIRTDIDETEKRHAIRIQAECKGLQAELEALKAENDQLKQQVADLSCGANKERNEEPRYVSFTGANEERNLEPEYISLDHKEPIPPPSPPPPPQRLECKVHRHSLPNLIPRHEVEMSTRDEAHLKCTCKVHPHPLRPVIYHAFSRSPFSRNKGQGHVTRVLVRQGYPHYFLGPPCYCPHAVT